MSAGHIRWRRPLGAGLVSAALVVGGAGAVQAGSGGGSSTPPPGGQIIITGSGPSTSSTPAPKPTSAPAPTPTSAPAPKPTSTPAPTPTSTPKPPDQCADVVCDPVYVARFHLYKSLEKRHTYNNPGNNDFGWWFLDRDSTENSKTLLIEGTGRAGAEITLTGLVNNEYYPRPGGHQVSPSCTTTVARDGSWSCRVYVAALHALVSSEVSFTVQQNGTDCCPDSSTEFHFRIFRAPFPEFVGDLYTPIAIDFSGQGAVETVSAARAPGVFDLLGDGRPARSGWLAPSAGFLVHDADDDGAIRSVDELFGGAVGEGYARLATFDTDRDGVITDADTGYHQLGVWRDRNMNKTVDADELFTLVEAGVVSLDLDHVDYWTGDAQGNYAYERSTAVLADGSVAAMADVYFRAAR